MGTVAEKLTLAQFEQQFSDQKPYYEYVAGRAFQKSMPTWVHGFIQKILMRLLDELGLFSASEVRAKISSTLELVPDVMATGERVRSVYADTPPAVVIEILSPSDSAQLLWKKCDSCSKWGVAAVYVVDPEARKVRMWDAALDTFSNVTEIQVKPYGQFLTELLWEELDKQIEL